MRRVIAVAFVAALAALLPTPARAQSNAVNSGASLPALCTVNSVYITTVTPTLYVCNPANTWTAVTWNGALPSGAVIFVASGSCPTGFTELSALNGRLVRGTVAANMNVGGTGGNDSYTPAGTISALSFTGAAWAAPAIAWPAGVPTFTGSSGTVPAQTFTGTPFTAIINHTHPATLTVQGGTTAATTGTHVMTSTATGGSARLVTAGDAAATSNPAGGVSSITPAGTNGTVSFTPAGTIAWPASVPTIGAYTPTGTINTPTFSGSAATVIPAYLNLIGCQKS